MLRAWQVSGLMIKQGGPNWQNLCSGGCRRAEKADKKFFPVIGFFFFLYTRHALQELGSKGGVLLQDSPVLMSLRVLTFLTRAHVRPETPTHVRPRHLRMYPDCPYIFDHVSWSVSVPYPNVFVSTTHSYAYVAFSITILFSTLYSGSCLLRDTYHFPISFFIVFFLVVKAPLAPSHLFL